MVNTLRYDLQFRFFHWAGSPASLWYPKIQHFNLKEFTDVDWEGSVDDRKSASGSALFLRNIFLYWSRKKQSSISLSTAEAEYITVVSCCTQVIWVKQTLEYLLVTHDHPIVINCYNTNSINMLKNSVLHSKTKHIPIKYHFLRGQVSHKIVKLEYVDTKHILIISSPSEYPRKPLSIFRQKLEVISLQ